MGDPRYGRGVVTDGSSMKTNEEIRIRWTGTARYSDSVANWAVRAARAFAVQWAAGPTNRVGIRRCVVYTEGVLGDDAAYIYFTPSKAVVVRIHGPEST